MTSSIGIDREAGVPCRTIRGRTLLIEIKIKTETVLKSRVGVIVTLSSSSGGVASGCPKSNWTAREIDDITEKLYVLVSPTFTLSKDGAV